MCFLGVHGIEGHKKIMVYICPLQEKNPHVLNNPSIKMIMTNNKTSYKNNWLVVSTHLKNISQNWMISPNRGENKTYLKPPPRHQLSIIEGQMPDLIFYPRKILFGKKKIRSPLPLSPVIWNDFCFSERLIGPKGQITSENKVFLQIAGPL